MYKEIDLTGYLIAGVVVSIPLVFLSETGRQDYAWWYIGLILLALMIFHAPQMTAFSKFLSSKF